MRLFQPSYTSRRLVLLWAAAGLATSALPALAQDDGAANRGPGVKVTTPPKMFTINFRPGSATLSAASQKAVLIARVYAAAESSGILARKLTVTGYSDAAGTAKHKADLADNRAKAVADALFLIGVPRAIIDTQSKAEPGPDAKTGGDATIYVEF